MRPQLWLVLLCACGGSSVALTNTPASAPQIAAPALDLETAIAELEHDDSQPLSDELTQSDRARYTVADLGQTNAAIDAAMHATVVYRQALRWAFALELQGPEACGLDCLRRMVF